MATKNEKANGKAEDKAPKADEPVVVAKQEAKINDAVTDSGAFKPNDRLADAPVNAPGSPVAGAVPEGAPKVSGNTASEAEGYTVDADGNAVLPQPKGKPGRVTYRFADGSTVTNDVDDIDNPPAVTHDEHGEGEIVRE